MDAPHGSALRPPTPAPITGRVLALARRSAGHSQEAFAELLGVSLDTIRGWETGRRRLPATRVQALVDVRHELAAAGAAPPLLAALDPALEADWLLARTLEPDPARPHPLGRLVTTRRTHDLLLWALTGRRPGWLPTSNGRPALTVPDRRLVFARLRELAATADGRTPEGLQLRRQAAFLAAFDPAGDTDRWLAQLPQPVLSRPRGGWTPGWVAARSRVITAAAHGDPDPLRWFIDHALDDQLEQAQLAWCAYYVGELAGPQRSDAFMADQQLAGWRGDRLLAWLAGQLTPACGYVDMAAHTLWVLLAARPQLATDPGAAGLAKQLETLDGSEVLSDRSRRELGQVAYLLAALNPKGNP
jgi:transcriptional regulator with XRE-family HTH domain